MSSDAASLRNRWSGAAVVVIASGPSVTSADLRAVSSWRYHGGDRRVIVVNTTFQSALWADIAYGADGSWWDVYADEVKRSFVGEPWTCSRKAATAHRLRYVEAVTGDGIPDLHCRIYTGGNSGYQAVGLAALFGARGIALLGFDMENDGARRHHHGDHPAGLRNVTSFGAWAQRLTRLAKELGARGVTIVNATRRTAIRGIDRVELSEALT